VLNVDPNSGYDNVH